MKIGGECFVKVLRAAGELEQQAVLRHARDVKTTGLEPLADRHHVLLRGGIGREPLIGRQIVSEPSATRIIQLRDRRIEISDLAGRQRDQCTELRASRCDAEIVVMGSARTWQTRHKLDAIERLRRITGGEERRPDDEDGKVHDRRPNGKDC